MCPYGSYGFVLVHYDGHIDLIRARRPSVTVTELIQAPYGWPTQKYSLYEGSTYPILLLLA